MRSVSHKGGDTDLCLPQTTENEKKMYWTQGGSSLAPLSLGSASEFNALCGCIVFIFNFNCTSFDYLGKVEIHYALVDLGDIHMDDPCPRDQISFIFKPAFGKKIGTENRLVCPLALGFTPPVWGILDSPSTLYWRLSKHNVLWAWAPRTHLLTVEWILSNWVVPSPPHKTRTTNKYSENDDVIFCHFQWTYQAHKGLLFSLTNSSRD